MCQAANQRWYVGTDKKKKIISFTEKYLIKIMSMSYKLENLKQETKLIEQFVLYKLDSIV